MIGRRTLLRGTAALAGAAAWPLSARSGSGAPGALRVASVKFGSLSWLLTTIKAEGLDTKNGFALDTLEIATNHAGPVALLAGEADVIVSDWTWALRQRGLGDKVKFAPYSSALGSLMVPQDSAIKSVADLKGKKLGIAGTAIDKSWILMRAYAKKSVGMDLADMVTPQFGAAPLITEEIKNGRLDAVLNFWTFSARLAGAGFRQMLSMSDVMKGLGVEPPPPLVGFIWKEDIASRKGAELAGFLAAAAAGNAILAKDDGAWERLKGLMKPQSDAEFTALRDYYRAGITGAWTSRETAAAERLTALLLEFGSKDVMGSGTRFDGELFHMAGI